MRDCPMSLYLDELTRTGLSLMIYRGEEVIFSSRGHGIVPLLEAVEAIGRDGLRGSIVVDKIVGRAAALLALYIGASEVHAGLISAGARELLTRCGLRHHFGRESSIIMGWGGSGVCPFEGLVADIDDPEEAYRRIRAKAREFKRLS